MHCIAIGIVLGADVLAGDPAFEQRIIRPRSMLLVAHLLAKFLEMRCDFGDL